MCNNAEARQYIQFYDDSKENVGLPLPAGMEGKIPEKAVCYQKFVIFVCVLETVGRKIEMKSEPFLVPGFVYPGATPIIDLAEVEKRCKSKGEFSLILTSMGIKGSRLIVNRLGTVSVFHDEDTIL